MPTFISHAAVPLGVGLGLGSKTISRPLLACGVIASVLPDLDVIGFKLGIPYSAALGHRGFSHSFVFAAVVAIVGSLAIQKYKTSFTSAIWFLFLSIVSHGLLDTLTTGGKGIALLWPFSDQRFFAPVQVIKVSPISISRFFTNRGYAVLISESAWIWLPAIVIGLSLFLIRRYRRPNLPFNPDPTATI